MSKVTIRMKNKVLSKIQLGPSGEMMISGVVATSDAASKGISAQLANPLTPLENTGNPGVPPSQLTAMTGEPASGGAAEQTAPNTIPEKDGQPSMQKLERSPIQKDPYSKELEAELGELEGPLPAPPSATGPAAGPNESLDTVTSDKVLMNETYNKPTPKDASQPVGGKKERG